MTTEATTELDLEAFREQARAWLAKHAPRDAAVRDRHDVAVFHRLSHGAELTILGRLRAWQKVKFDAATPRCPGRGSCTAPAYPPPTLTRTPPRSPPRSRSTAMS